MVFFFQRGRGKEKRKGVWLVGLGVCDEKEKRGDYCTSECRLAESRCLETRRSSWVREVPMYLYLLGTALVSADRPALLLEQAGADSSVSGLRGLQARDFFGLLCGGIPKCREGWFCSNWSSKQLYYKYMYSPAK